MDWNLLNTRNREERENPNTVLDLSKYEIKRPKKVNPTYELRKELASIVRRPLMQVLGLTKGWSEADLNGCITDAKAFTKNTPAYAWKIIKQVNERRKTNTKKGTDR